MACLVLKPEVAGWLVRTNPLSYGGTPKDWFWYKVVLISKLKIYWSKNIYEKKRDLLVCFEFSQFNDPFERHNYKFISIRDIKQINHGKSVDGLYLSVWQNNE